jgi:hypothetical protein
MLPIFVAEAPEGKGRVARTDGRGTGNGIDRQTPTSRGAPRGKDHRPLPLAGPP